MTPPHIINLAKLFDGRPTLFIPANTKLYRGCWLQQSIFPSGNWFSPTVDGAAQYVAMHAKVGRERNYSPNIFEACTTTDLYFVEFDQNHIQAFESAYGDSWTHERIVKDIPLAFAHLGRTNWSGFYRPQSQEYFVSNPGVDLTQGKTWCSQHALAEASRVKGFTV